MIDLGFPYLAGYKPRSNYQALLADVIAAQVKAKPVIDEIALAAVQRPAVTPAARDFAKVKADSPSLHLRAAEPPATLSLRAIKRDYLEREALNQSLGLAGEQFIVQYEHWRLAELGEHRLADRVEHVSQSQGDGLGYDVLSFDSDGRERFIEVKTTSFGRETPFFVSRGELNLSRSKETQFHLYRLFEFRNAPRLFGLIGSLDKHCLLDPITYKATFS
jgi:hypothetical protein